MFIFALLCGASKGFMKALKAYKERFEAPQRSVKKNLSWFLFQYNFLKCTGREWLRSSSPIFIVVPQAFLHIDYTNLNEPFFYL